MFSASSLRRWLKFLAAIAVSLLFSALFLRSLDLGDLLDALAAANYVYVVPALGLFLLSVGVRAARWRYFLEPYASLSWRSLLPSLLVGYAGNNLLPARAGELLRVQHLADHHGVPRMQAFGTLMMERLYDGIVLASFVLWGLLLTDSGTAYLGLGLALAGAATAGFLICGLVANNPAVAFRLAKLLPFLSERVQEKVSSLGESFFKGFAVLTNPSRFFWATVTSLLAWSLELGMYWLISLGFNLDASLISVAFAGAAANVAMSLPGAQGGVGPFQYFATEALLRFGVVEASAAAYSLALHIFLVVPVSLVGLAVLWRATMPRAASLRKSAVAMDSATTDD